MRDIPEQYKHMNQEALYGLIENAEILMSIVNELDEHSYKCETEDLIITIKPKK